MRRMILEELYNSVQKLEKFTVLEVSAQVVSEVASTVAIAAMGVKVGWINKIFGDIAAKREHFNLLPEAQNLEKKIEQLARKKVEAVRRFEEIEEEMVYED